MSEAASMEVLQPGLSTTFQDLGRWGYQHLGVPVSGAMDEVSHRLANWLVGNDETEATLEITVVGPALRFSRPVLMALSGAELCAERVKASGEVGPVALNRAIGLESGDVLRFGRRLFGARCYLAVQGGFGLASVMGSASTYARGALSGLHGRALIKGDRVALPAATSDACARAFDSPLQRLVEAMVAELDPAPIRAIRGPEWEDFERAAQASFFRDKATVAPQAERMGFRLSGLVLRRSNGARAEMLSQGVALGAVQVPPDGAPIVLMADRQTTGGYPRIAQVATVDMPRLAQAMPGDSIRFEAIEAEEAEALLLERAERFARLRAALLGPSTAHSPRTRKRP